MQPSGNLDLQPGDNVKIVTEEEGREGGPAVLYCIVDCGSCAEYALFFFFLLHTSN